MRKLADLHTHTPLCGHAGNDSAGDFARAAIQKNLAFFGASDHYPLPPPWQTGNSMKKEDFPRYRDTWMNDLRTALDGSGVEALFGAELDFIPGVTETPRREAEKEDFDYRISSIHFVGDFAFDNPVHMTRWRELSPDFVWKRYAELMAQMVEGGGFEIIGHLDLPKKFKIYHSDRKFFLNAMTPVFELAANKDIRMELNTAGLRKQVQEIYPSKDLLQAAHDAGVEITFGSDAHQAADVGADFDAAAALAKACGYTRIWAYRKKQPVEIPLD